MFRDRAGIRAAAALASLACVLLLAVACSSGESGDRPNRSSSASTSVPPPVTPSAPSASVDGVSSGGLPRPGHIVVVVEENHAAANIIGAAAAPYLNSLARSGATFTHSYAITHPSEPNYLAMFSGSTQKLTDDSCPHAFSGPNLASQLLHAGRSFRGYSESLPAVGYSGCTDGNYARRHVPWTDFPALPTSVNQPFIRFPRNYAALPTLSFVIPNLQHDMHNGTIAQGDSWLRKNLSGYATWAAGHNSLLVITWDEDDDSHGNRIPTIVVGAHVRPGRYGEHVTHYRMLRTLEALERLSPIGAARSANPIADIWRR